MSETSIPVELPVTPLAALPDLAGPTVELAPYRGARSVRAWGALDEEIAALATGVAVHDLGWLRRVTVRGEDRFRWLSGMVTNAVNELAPNSGAWNLVLNAQGRILGDLHVWREGDRLELVIAADQTERLLAHLDRYIIMDDVELVPLATESALGLSGPQAAALLSRLGLPALAAPLTAAHAEWKSLPLRILRVDGALIPHYELWLPTAEIASLWKALIEAGASPVGIAALDALRIAEGTPLYGIDIAERDLPQETSQLQTLHFNKGCYQGQEIVERIRSRGNVHRHLRQLELFGSVPAAGSELTFQNAAGAEAPAGVITSAVELPLATGSRIFALGMIRGEAELRSQPLSYASGGKAEILKAPPDFLAQQS